MIINAWLIASRKTAANLTFSKWKRLTTGRQKRGKGLTNASQSVIDHQQAMTETVALFSKIAPVIKIGFKKFNSSIGNYAAWIKKMMDNAWDFSTPGSPVFNAMDMKTSIGPMQTETGVTVSGSDGDPTVSIGWDGLAEGYWQLPTDKPVLLVYNVNKDAWAYETDAGGDRSNGIWGVGFAAGEEPETGDVLIGYLSFTGTPGARNAGLTDRNAIATYTVL